MLASRVWGYGFSTFISDSRPAVLSWSSLLLMQLRLFFPPWPSYSAPASQGFSAGFLSFLRSMGRREAIPPATLHLGLDTVCFLLEIFFLGSLWSPVTPLKQQFWFFKAGGQESWWFGLFPGNSSLAPPSVPSLTSVRTLNWEKGNHIFQMNIIKQRTQEHFPGRPKHFWLQINIDIYPLYPPIHSLIPSGVFVFIVLVHLAGNTIGIFIPLNFTVDLWCA